MLCYKTSKKQKIINYSRFHRAESFKPKKIVLELDQDTLNLDLILNQVKNETSIGLIKNHRFDQLKVNFKQKIDIIEQQLIFNNENYEEYPSDYIHCLISNHVYNLNKTQYDNLHLKNIWNELNAKNWIIYDTLKITGYKSILYLNEKNKQLVLAIQGFKFNQKDQFLTQYEIYIKSLSDLISNQILGLLYHLKKSIQLSEILNYSLSFTGYSFGGLFAQLCVYLSHKYFNKTNVKAVTFESIGTFNLFSQINNSNSIDLDKLNIKSYTCQSNTIEPHLGKLIFSPNSSLLSSLRNSEKFYEIFSRKQNQEAILINEFIKFKPFKELLNLINDSNLINETPITLITSCIINILKRSFQTNNKKENLVSLTNYSLIQIIDSKVLDLNSNELDKQLFMINSLKEFNFQDDLLFKQLNNLKSLFKVEIVNSCFKLKSCDPNISIEYINKRLIRLNSIYSNLNQMISNNDKNLFIYQYIKKEKEKFLSSTNVSNYIDFNLDLIEDQVTLLYSEPSTGKLTYCLKYAEKRLKNSTNLCVKLFDSKTNCHLLYDLFKFAQELQLDSFNSNNIFDKIKNELNSHKTIDFLIIFKNIKHFEIIKDFLIGLNENIKVILTSNESVDYQIKKINFNYFTLDKYVELSKSFRIDKLLELDQDIRFILDKLPNKNITRVKCLFNIILNMNQTNLRLENINSVYENHFEMIKSNNLNLNDSFQMKNIIKNNQIILEILKYLIHLDGDYLNETLIKSIYLSIEPNGQHIDYILKGLKKYCVIESLSNFKIYKSFQNEALDYFKSKNNEKILINKLITSIFSLPLTDYEIIFKQIFILLNSNLVKNNLFYLEQNLNVITTKLNKINIKLYEFLKLELEKFKENLTRIKTKNVISTLKLENTLVQDYKYWIDNFVQMKTMFNFQSQINMIYGDTGCGKTSICIKYAQLKVNNENNLVVRLLDASTEHVLIYDLYKLGSNLNIYSNRTNLINLIKLKFEQLKPVNFLLIIDNLQQNETLLQMVNDILIGLTLNVKVLITTQFSYLQYKIHNCKPHNFYYNHHDFYKLFGNYSILLKKTLNTEDKKKHLTFMYECKLEKENKPRGILKVNSFLNTLLRNPNWTKNEFINYYQNKFKFVKEQNENAFNLFQYLTVLNPSYLNYKLLKILFELVCDSNQFNETIEFLVNMSLLFKISNERFITYASILNELNLDYSFKIEAKHKLVNALIRMLDNKQENYDIEICFKQFYEIFTFKSESVFSQKDHNFFQSYKQPVNSNYFLLIDSLKEINSNLLEWIELANVNNDKRKEYLNEIEMKDKKIFEQIEINFDKINLELDEFIDTLKNGELIINEHFSDVKRRLQLFKEERILDLKKENKINQNLEVENLPIELLDKANIIDNENEEYFNMIETYEKQCLNTFNLNCDKMIKKCEMYQKNLKYLQENWSNLKWVELCSNKPMHLNLYVVTDVIYEELDIEFRQKIHTIFYSKGKPIFTSFKIGDVSLFKFTYEKSALSRKDSKKCVLRELSDYIIKNFEQFKY